MARLRASRIGTPVKMNTKSSYWFILLALWSFLCNNNSSNYLWKAVAYRVLLVDCRQVSTMGWELRRLEGVYSTGSGTVTINSKLQVLSVWTDELSWVPQFKACDCDCSFLFTTLAPSEQYIRSMQDYKSSYFVYAMLTELLRFIILHWIRVQFY